ncbi:MAG TPA: hypothetical protein VGX76_21465, partial [Pirellulales bacterium]|nr:hypothetical protein [Pirellulales bacterium]
MTRRDRHAPAGIANEPARQVEEPPADADALEVGQDHDPRHAPHAAVADGRQEGGKRGRLAVDQPQVTLGGPV